MIFGQGDPADAVFYLMAGSSLPSLNARAAAMLEASGIGEDEDNGATGFDEKIRQLIVAALAV